MLAGGQLTPGQAWVVRTVSEGAKNPALVLALRAHDAEGRGPLPDDFAASRDLEQPPGAAFADQDVVVRQPVSAGDVGAVELLLRIRGVLPDDAACPGVDFNDSRSRLADTVVAV